MFAFKPQKEIAVRILLIAVILFNAFSSTQAFAKSPSIQDPVTSPTPTETITETPTTEPTIPPTETLTPIVATATPAPVSTTTETPTPSVTLAPSTGDQSTIPTLSLSTDPDFVVPGKSLTLNWVVEITALQERQLVLQIILPEGITPKDKKAVYDPASYVLTVAITDSSGQIDLEVSATSGDVTVTAVLLEDQEILAETKLFIPMREQFKLDKTGGAIETRDGKIKVEFSNNTLPEATVIQIGKPAREALPNGALLGVPFEITAYGDMSKQELKKFSKELTLTVAYADLGIPPEREGDLHVYWYNETTKEWEALPTWVDKKTKTLQALTDHFTVFDLNVSNWQSNHLPTVDAFQVSGFTGAGTYSLPIQLPAGPGGFQPSLALTYNSQVVDQSTLDTQASWVGMGWSLDSSYIELDTHGTGEWTYDDTYLLQVGGISTRIVLDGAGSYRAVDENFWKITKASNAWIVQDKQGTTYYFEYVSSYPYETQAAPNCSGYDFAGYRWSLTRVRNIFNQEIQYTYTTQTKGMYVEQYITSTGACYLDTIYPITATYPETIVYANGRYRVRFDKGSSPNRLDYQAAWDGPGEFNAYEKYRLQNIYVEQDADGNNVFETILRRYQFTYKANTDSDIIFPSYTWSAGGKTTTLKSVQEFGVGGTASLPATTFTYGDNLHLTRVDNGYGGAVEFTYGRWYDATNARKSYTVEQQFGQPSYPCRIDDWQPWTALYGEMNCGDGYRDPLHIWGTHGMGIAYDFYNSSYSVYGVNHSKDLIRPGGVYKLTTNVSWQPGMSVQVGVFDGIRFQLFYVNTSSNTNIISLPVDAYAAQVVIDETGGSGIGNNHPAAAAVSYLKLELLPSIYRVTQKKIYESPTDANPDVYSYNYTKNGVESAAFNDGVIAPTSTCDPSTPSASCFEFFQRFSEFRGHAQVTETGPDGRQTITQYFQDDLLKGRPSSVTSTDGAKTITKATYAYTSVPLSLGIYTSCNGCPAFLGLGRNWVYTNAVENRNYDLNGNYQTTRTAYTYDASNGNLISQTEQVWNGSSWSNYRTTETNYFPNLTKYLVSLPARQQIRDANNNIIAETLNIYDSNTAYDQTPGLGLEIGKLTAVRMWVDGAQSTGRYSQVAYGYDGYGNRTSIITYGANGYSGYGVASSAPPAAGAANATTVYDPIFHVYPISQTTPSTPNVSTGLTTSWLYDYDNNGVNDYILGVPTKETDANGNQTSALYDAFGRMLKLIRPGDDSVNPTLNMAYQDAYPFTTTITQKINTTQTYSVQRVYDGMGRQTRISSGGINVDTVYVSATQTKQSLPYANGETVSYTTTTLNPTARATTVTAADTTSTTTASNGLVTTTTDARGNQTVTASDVWGRIVAVTPPTGPAVAYAYDEMNRLVSAVRGSNAVPPVGTNPGTTNLVSWWSLNEAVGMRNDSYSNNPLTDTNAVAATAKQGNAASFVMASSKYLSIPDNATLSMGAGQRLSMCTWVKLTNTSARGNLVAKGGADGNYAYILRYLETVNRFNFIATTTGSSAQFVGVSADAFGAVAVGAWNFVCSGYDGSNLWIQVNAGARNTVPMAGDIFNDSGNLNLGALNNIYGFLGGDLDETLIYKRNLSTTEITWLYNNGSGRAYANLTDPAGPGTTNLISWWGLNETGGTRYDSYGANHLTDVNTVEAAAKQGNAATFVSANSKYLSAGDNASLSMNGTNFTIAGWVKFTTAGAENQVVVGKQGSGSLNEYQIYKNTSNKLVFTVYGNTSGSIGASAMTTNSVTAGWWYFFTAVYDGSNVKISLNAATFDSVPYSGGAVDNTNSFRIGANTGGNYLNGSVDEVVAYKRALSQAEVYWLFNNGKGRSYADLTVPPPAGTSTTTLTYDHAGRKLTMTDPDMGTWSYGYDALGNLTSQTDARLCTLTLTYDALSRLSTKSSNNDTDCVTQVNTTYTYDVGANGKGQRTSMNSGSVSNSWTYDTRGRMLSETVNAGTAYTTQWTYNAADMPLTMTYPDTETVTYGYNSRMLLDSVIGTSTYVSSTTYDSAGRMDVRNFGNTTKTDYDYFPWTQQGGRLQYLKSGTSGSPTSLQNMSYAYDAVGNIANITDTKASETSVYGYDALDRLTSWTLNNGTPETYGYDSASGNLDTKAGVGLIYNAQVTCSTGNRTIPHAVSDMSNNHYTYDCNGSQITRRVGGQTFNLSYNAENRLVSVSGAATATFVYDGDGRRVKSTVNGTTTTFVGSHYEVTGSQVTKYYFAGTQRVAMRTGSTLSYLLSDHLGSTSITTNSSGALVSELRYKPWGETRYSSGTSPTKYQYTGQYSYQSDFGLLFYNARWVDPALGRFVQADSIIPEQSQGVQAWDRFAYTNNNPMRYTDPSGHVVACDNDDWACQYHWDYPITYDDSEYELDNITKKIRSRLPRPVNGVHLGGSVQYDVFLGGGGYGQGDLLFDWTRGMVYVMGTSGSFVYAGTPNIISGETYVGFTNVYGIPNTDDDISSLLSGENWDGAVSLGADALGKLETSKGLSVDLDPTTHKPVYSEEAGYQYATEDSLVFGFNVIPNAVDSGVETGFSYSVAKGIPMYVLLPALINGWIYK